MGRAEQQTSNWCKRRKATSVSTFDFSALYTKLPHNTLLMVLNSLIDFCFGGGENTYITGNSYGARWVKNMIIGLK